MGLNMHGMRDVIIYTMKRGNLEGWGAGGGRIKLQYVVSD